MPMVVANGKTIFFAHVPKAGGTSVANYLERRFGHLLLSDRRRYRSKCGTALIVPPDHFAVADLEEFLPPHLDYAFAIVRHPISRIVSEYCYQRGSSRLSSLTFSTWLRVVLECARREPRMYENHIRPQSDLVPDFAEPFRIEQGCEAIIPHIEEIVQESSPEIRLPHLNQSRKHDVRLSKQDVFEIRDFYAADYKRFNYEFIDTSQLPNDPFASMRASAALALAPIVVRAHKHGWTK
jgi:hypothetical protein